ncbi:ABC transporter ATP-binding protein [Fervidicoccus fontis]|uniref:ABC transporter ATP-binding protein n=1 Tax=Fervidicoccus fontis TaxID=683846 RepID=A0A843AD23_9CREN|nr:ABC transporter ATP-binding protein [Fervidicoccus fontis]
MSDVAIKAEDVWKIYNQNRTDEVIALRGLNLEIKKGTITTLLGKNGAGKTTFLRIIATQLIPTKGNISVLGYDVIKDVWKIREKIAVIPQDAKPLLFPSPLEFISSFLVMRGYSFSDARKRAKETLSELEIPEEYWNRAAWDLSGGYQRRLLLAAVMASDSELILLDEPSVGLDPIARMELWGKITLLKKMGKTVLLTTHYMEEAEMLSDHVIIIDKGKKILEGNPKELINSFKWKHKIEVLDECDISLMKKMGVLFGSRPPFVIYLNSSIDSVLEELNSNGCRASASLTTLEDVFLYAVGEEKWSIIKEE